MKKTNATTVIRRENYKNTVWQLLASDLLYVSRSTWLALMNISTIGNLAQCDPKRLQNHLGVIGVILHLFASGEDGLTKR